MCWTVERGQLGDTRALHWQTDTSVSNKSWGYIKDDTFKSPEFVVHQLIDIVSKNGNLLLNIGPRSDGTIPEEVQQVLLDVGTWLNVNGDAIYGTRPWRTYGEGPTKVAAGSFHDTDTAHYTAEDFRFTTKDHALYAIGLAWPTNGEAVIRSLAAHSGKSIRTERVTVGQRCKTKIPAASRWIARATACAATGQVCVRAPFNVLRANLAVGIDRRRIREIRQFFILLRDGCAVDCRQSSVSASHANGARDSHHE